MSTEGVGYKKAKEIFSVTGGRVPDHVHAGEQVIIWACSQAAIQAANGNPISATMILEAVVGLVRPDNRSVTTEGHTMWSLLYDEEYQEAKQHLLEQIAQVFYGAGGTSMSVEELLEY